MIEHFGVANTPVRSQATVTYLFIASTKNDKTSLLAWEIIVPVDESDKSDHDHVFVATVNGMESSIGRSVAMSKEGQEETGNASDTEAEPAQAPSELRRYTIAAGKDMLVVMAQD